MRKQNGRPRDARIDDAVLGAAAELLAEVGYADLTVAAVAERAGTSRPAVYRRWPTKAHLVHQATFGAGDPAASAGSGVLAEDVRELVRRTAELLTAPLARIAVPGLIAEAANDPVLNRRVLDRFADTGWQGLQSTVERAIERGELDARVDALSLVELVVGAALAASLIRGPDGLDTVWIDHTTRLVLDGARSRPDDSR